MGDKAIASGLTVARLTELENLMILAVEEISKAAKNTKDASTDTVLEKANKSLQESKSLITTLKKLEIAARERDNVVFGHVATAKRIVDGMKGFSDKPLDDIAEAVSKELTKEDGDTTYRHIIGEHISDRTVAKLKSEESGDDTFRKVIRDEAVKAVKEVIENPNNLKVLLDTFFESESYNDMLTSLSTVSYNVEKGFLQNMGLVMHIHRIVVGFTSFDQLAKDLTTLQNSQPGPIGSFDPLKDIQVVYDFSQSFAEIASADDMKELTTKFDKALQEEGLLPRMLKTMSRNISATRRATTSQSIQRAVTATKSIRRVRNFVKEFPPLISLNHAVRNVNRMALAESQNPGASADSLNKLITWLTAVNATPPTQTPKSMADLLTKLSSFQKMAKNVGTVLTKTNTLAETVTTLMTSRSQHLVDFDNLRKTVNACAGDVYKMKVQLLGVEPDADSGTDKIDGALIAMFNGICDHYDDSTKTGGKLETALKTTFNNILGDGSGPLFGPGLLRPIPATYPNGDAILRVKVSNFWSPDSTDSVMLWGRREGVQKVQKLIAAGHERLTFSGLGDAYDQSCTALTIALNKALPTPSDAQTNWEYVLGRNDSEWQESVSPRHRLNDKAIDPDNLHLEGIIALISSPSLQQYYGDDPTPAVGLVVIAKSRYYGGYTVSMWRFKGTNPTSWVILCCEDAAWAPGQELSDTFSRATKWSAFGTPERDPRGAYLLSGSALKRRIDESSMSLQLGMPVRSSVITPVNELEGQIAAIAGLRSPGSATSSERIGAISANGLGYNLAYLNGAVDSDTEDITAQPGLSMMKQHANKFKQTFAHFPGAGGKRKADDASNVRDEPAPFNSTIAHGSAFQPNDEFKNKYGRGTYITLGPLHTTYARGRFPPVIAEWLAEHRGRLLSRNQDGLGCCVESVLAELILKRERQVLTWTDIDDTCDECKAIGDRNCFVVVAWDIIIYKGTSPKRPRTAQGTGPNSQQQGNGATTSQSPVQGGNAQAQAQPQDPTRVGDQQTQTGTTAGQAAGQASTTNTGQPSANNTSNSTEVVLRGSTTQTSSAQQPQQQQQAQSTALVLASAATPQTQVPPQPVVPAGVTLPQVPLHYGAGQLIHIGLPQTTIQFNNTFLYGNTADFMKRRKKRNIGSSKWDYSLRRYAYERNKQALDLCIASLAATRRDQTGWTDTNGPCDECHRIGRHCYLTIDDSTAFYKGLGRGPP